jgi:putative DNA primase/helicase
MNIKLDNKTEQEKEEEKLVGLYIEDASMGAQAIAGYLIDRYHLKTIGERTRDIYRYKDGIYIFGTNEMRAEIQRMLTSLVSKHYKNEIIEKIKDSTMIDRKEFSADRDLVNLNNGVLNIRTGTITDHDPRHLFFNKIAANYKKESDCARIKKFLSEILDKDDVPIIQEWFGYALYRRYFIKKAIIFVGEGDTGKTTLLRLFERFMGKDNVSGVSLQKITSDKFAAAHFYNKHVNIYDDLSFKDISDNGAFKIATGGGSITGEYKFGEQFQFENYAKLTFACNKIPDVKDPNDTAYFGRWIIIHFRNEVASPDKFLIDKITTPEELSGLLNFALEGLNRLLEKQKFSYNKAPHEIKMEMQRSGSVIAQFVHDCLKEATGNWASKAKMYDAFLRYARSKNLPADTMENLGKKIRNYADYILDGKKLETNPLTKNKVQVTGWRNVEVIGDIENVDRAEPPEDELGDILGDEYQQEIGQRALIS